jgi:predicted ribosomally synthesized peptide with SipW-like signal peptide
MRKSHKVVGAFGVTAVAFMGLGLTGTGAWFTDQETSTVSATAGEVDIVLNGDAKTSLTVDNVMPGVEQGPYSLKIYNQGSTVPVKYRVTTDFAQNEPLEDVLRVRVEHGNCVSDPGTGSELGQNGNLIDIEPTKLVRNVNFTEAESITGGSGLAVNNTHCFELYFSLTPSADNSYQGQSATFDLVVDATQLENPGFNQ